MPTCAFSPLGKGSGVPRFIPLRRRRRHVAVDALFVCVCSVTVLVCGWSDVQRASL